MSRDEQIFIGVTFSTFKLAFLVHKYKKTCKRDKEQNYAVDGHGLANNCDRKIQGQTNILPCPCLSLPCP